MSTLLLVVPGPQPGLDVCAELRNYHTQFEQLHVQWLACHSGTLSRGAQALAACRSIFDQATQWQLLFITTGHAPAEERRQASGEVAKAASWFQQRVDDIKPALAELDVEGSLNTFARVAVRLDYMKELSAEMVNHYRHSADQLYKSVFLDFLGKLAFHKIDPNHLADAAVQAAARQSTFRERGSEARCPRRGLGRRRRARVVGKGGVVWGHRRRWSRPREARWTTTKPSRFASASSPTRRC
jgi:hypothetical protein